MSAGRRGIVAAAAGTGLGLAGAVLEVRRARCRPPEPGGPPLGSVRGGAREVVADDGVVLHAEVDEPDEPSGSGATLVLVHGFALTLDCWHFQRLAFRGRRRLVLYDQRSHGSSGRGDPARATMEQLGRDLAAVLDALAPDEPVVLVGHSMGGMALVAYAEEHPEAFGDRVVGVGLISTTAGGQRTHKVLSRHVPDALGRRLVERGLLVVAQRERLLELVRRSGGVVARRVIEEFAFGRPVPRSYVTFLDQMIAATPLSVLVEFVPQFDALDKFSVVAAFSRVPTTIICGTDDKLTAIGHARKLHAHIDGSRLVELEGGGHVPLLEHAEQVDDALEELLEQADRVAAGEPAR